MLANFIPYVACASFAGMVVLFLKVRNLQKQLHDQHSSILVLDEYVQESINDLSRYDKVQLTYMIAKVNELEKQIKEIRDQR